MPKISNIWSQWRKQDSEERRTAACLHDSATRRYIGGEVKNRSLQMNENNSDSSDGPNTGDTISTAGATVHSDDFQIHLPSVQWPRDDTLDKASPCQQTAKRFFYQQDENAESAKVALESDSRVPSVSSRASIPSTSSCKSSTAGLDDQEQPQQNIKSTDSCNEEEKYLKERERRKALWKRHQREAKRIAWERRYATRAVLVLNSSHFHPLLGQQVTGAVHLAARVRRRPSIKVVVGMVEGRRGVMTGVGSPKYRAMSVRLNMF